MPSSSEHFNAMSLRKLDLLQTLNGLVCIYKPADVKVTSFVSSFATKLCSDLNSVDANLPANYLVIQSKTDSVSVNIRPSYLCNKLATGPRYNPEDVNLLTSPIGTITSGVCVVGINRGIQYIKELKKYTPIKVFHIKGKLGEATRFLYKGEKVMARAKYSKVSKTTMDKVLSGFQAAHQRKILAEFGVNIQSQAAYELAVEGILRPLEGHIPVLYSIKCVEFEPPEFTLEIICIQENENYLLKFVHDLGLELRSFAHCTGMRCIRYGPFRVDHTLLIKECTLENLKKNMYLCHHLMVELRGNKTPYLKPVSQDDGLSQNGCIR